MHKYAYTYTHAYIIYAYIYVQIYIHIYIYIYVYMYLLIYTSYMRVYLFISSKIYISLAASKLSLSCQWIPPYHTSAIFSDCRDTSFQRYLERFLVHTPAMFFLLSVEIFSLLVFWGASRLSLILWHMDYISISVSFRLCPCTAALPWASATLCWRQFASLLSNPLLKWQPALRSYIYLGK